MTLHDPLLDAAEHLRSAARFTRDAAAEVLSVRPASQHHTRMWQSLSATASDLEYLMDEARSLARADEDTADHE
jgi:hypothetical protein